MARKMKAEILKEIGCQLNDAKESESMICIFRVEDGKVILYRVTNDFPKVDHATAVKLLEDDLAKIGKPHPLGGTRT